MKKKQRRQWQKSTKLKAVSFGRFKKKIVKPLVRLIKKKREKNHINKIRNKLEKSLQTTQKYKRS